MIRHLYPDRAQRARSLGIWAAVSSLGLALGPLIGSLLVYGWSWRAIFWFNVFFGALAFVSAAHRAPRELGPRPGPIRHPGVPARSPRARVAHLRHHPGRDGRLPDLVDRPALLLRRCSQPSPSSSPSSAPRTRYSTSATSRYPPSHGSNIIAFTVYFGTFAIFFMVALYLQVVGIQLVAGPGLDFLPLAVGMVAASLLTGRWVAAWGPGSPWPRAACSPASGSSSPTPYLPQRRHRPHRLDDVPRRCRRRHRHGARHLGRTGLGPGRALGHGRIDHQHLPRARGCGRRGRPRLDRQWPPDRQPRAPAHRDRHPEGVPIARGVP